MIITRPRSAAPFFGVIAWDTWPFWKLFDLSDEIENDQPTGRIVVTKLEAPVKRVVNINGVDYSIRDYDNQPVVFFNENVITDVAEIKRLIHEAATSEEASLPENRDVVFRIGCYTLWIERTNP
jgi:hypothetical protein